MKLLFILSLMIIGINLNSINGCFEIERRALLTFKTGQDPDNLLTSWHGQNCCNWSGVGCEKETGHVVRLNFSAPNSYYYLQGSNIDPSLLHLKHLTHLELSYIDFDIEIPEFIGSFENLIYLDLSRSFFCGIMPYQLGNLSKLRYLDLGYSNFIGTIPAQLGNLSNLRHLSLDNAYGDNFPVGHISWISRLSSLKYLDMSNNNLNGVVFSPEIHNMSSLETLILSECDLSGSLEYILLASNNFEGPLSSFLSGLLLLDLSNNNISGPFPTKMNLTSIMSLRLSGNYISDTIPSYICDMQGLKYLSLSNNVLSGEIPSCWNKTNLIMMDLSNNDLTGELPTSLGSLTGLQTLQLYNNNLHGEIPITLKHCKNIVFLGLGRNKFSGKIPSWIGTSLKNLVIIQLQSNMFSGFIPRELGQLAYLRILDLAHNYLVGFVTSSLGNFSAIRNNTSTNFYLEFVSTRHMYVEIIEGAFFVDLFGNIEGQDLSIDVLSILDQFTSIDLSRNNLSGMIPKEIGSLKYLINLNLSLNRLVGEIPYTIGSMPFLEWLDLSFNELSGSVPYFPNLNHLNLSYNNLSGKIPYGDGYLDTLDDPSIYIENAYLCGPPTNTTCLEDGRTIVDIGVDKKGIEMSWLFYRRRFHLWMVVYLWCPDILSRLDDCLFSKAR